MEDHKRYKIKGTKDILRIVVEDSPMSPRSWDNLGICAFFHRNYNIGDTALFLNVNDYDSWAEMKEAILKDFDGAVILPVYMYDHSGITISTSPFSCPWDSMQIGFIYTTKARIRDTFATKRVTKIMIKKATNVLQSEIKVLDQYVRGDVYGFIIEDKEGNHKESCYGFFGDDFADNGLFDHAGVEANDLIQI